MKKKHILLITHAFSPQLRPRAFRWEIIVNFLINKEYKIDILLPKYNSIQRPNLKNVKYYEAKEGIKDNILNKKIIGKEFHNANNNINNCNTLKIKNIFKVCNILFNFFAWPDSSLIWYFFAKKQLQKMIKNNQYDCIISSSVPFTSHLLGFYAKKQLKIKWIAEYGDPFSFNSQPAKSVFRFLNKYIEKKVIKKMDYIVVPFEGAKKGFLIHFPFLKENKIKIINQIIPSINSNPDKIKWEQFNKDKVNIVYAGTFYIPIRSPKILLEALVKLKKEDIFAYYKIRIHVFGPIGRNLKKNIFNKYRQLMSEKIVILYGETQREVCAFAYQKSDYLLSIANDSEYQLPSKLIEYLSFKKPIISLEYPKSNTPNWSFLIKVNYQIDNLVNIFKEISKANFKFSLNEYDKIIKQYNPDVVIDQYLNLIS